MSTELGNRAEDLAACFLENEGLQILNRNWRNRFCEIDIVAKGPSGGIHFIEVKYRHNPNYGSGYEYITPDKVRRLRRAALFWMTEYRQTGDYQIDVVSVDGALDNKPSIEYLPNVVGQ